MAFMRIHCATCGGHWEVYSRDHWTDGEDVRVCPHCFEEIDPDLWQREIAPAFGKVLDTNRELEGFSAGYKEPMFSVDFISDNMDRKNSSFSLDDYEGEFKELDEELENFSRSLDELDVLKF